MPSNYPPGVTDSMIPGNSNRDKWFEEIWDMVDDEIVDAYEADPYWKDKVDNIISDYDSDHDETEAVVQAIESFYWECVTPDEDEQEEEDEED